MNRIEATRPPLRPGAWDIALALFFGILAFGRFLSAVDDTPFHRDEARWIHRAYFIREWADPFGPRWQDEGYEAPYRTLDERYRMRSQPPLGSYLMGLGLLVQGRDLTPNGFWIMERNDAWNVARGNMPAHADLLAARRTNAAVGALTVLCVYLIGRRLANRVAGAAAALLLTFHPLMLTLATQALADALVMLVTALAAIAAYRLADRPSWGRAAVLGALLGLGGATKLSPLLLTIPLAGFGVLLLAWRTLDRDARGDAGRLGIRLAVLPLVAAATFLAVYPYLWPDPIDHARAMFAFRADSMELQAAVWPVTAVESREEALARIGLQLGTYDSTSGWLATRLRDLWGVDWNLSGLDLAMAIAGFEIVVALVLIRGLTSGTALAAAVLIGQAAVTVMGMRVDFYRYHATTLVAVAICAGVAVGYGWLGLRWLARAMEARRAAPAWRPAEVIADSQPTEA